MNRYRLNISHLCFALVVASSTLVSQERFQEGAHKGFTKSATEHIIVEIETPFVVKSAAGVVTMRDQEPLEGVLVEIRGPGEAERVRSTTTDSKGRFAMAGLASGRYQFKMTKNGWQSVVGTIVVSPNAKVNARININMPVGV